MGCFSSEWILPTAIALARRDSHSGRNAKRLNRMSRSRRAGASMIARTAEIAIAKFFVNARGRKSRPSCASSAKTGVKETAMTRSEKKLGRPHFLDGADQDLPIVSRTPGRLPVLQLLVGVLDHDDRGVDERSDGDGDAPERHDVRADPEEVPSG